MTALAYHRLQKGWDLRPLKHIAALNPEVLPEDTDPGWTFPYVDIGNVTFEAGITGTELVRFADAPSRARRRVRNGDTIVSTVRTYLRAIAPVSNQPDGLIASTGFAVVRAKPPTNAGYLSWALRSSTFVEAVVADSVGVSYPAIAPSVLGALPVPVPPPAEQHAIADFLDRETAKIDALIATQERLIALLDEKRQATITHAVTKGLDPDAPMKESGVEWLGEVPVEWDIKPLKFLFLVRGGATPSKDELAYWNGGIPWVTPKDMKIPVISTTEDTVSPQALSDGRLSMLPTGAILVVVRGMILAKRVPIAETSNPVTINQDMKALIFKASGVPAFFRYFLSACAGIFDGLIEEAGHGTKTLRTDWLGRIALPAPSASEQEAIVRYLDSSLEQFDRLTRQSTEVTERLRERRTALITAAVTGQIDVSRPAITEAAE